MSYDKLNACHTASYHNLTALLTYLNKIIVVTSSVLQQMLNIQANCTQ